MLKLSWVSLLIHLWPYSTTYRYIHAEGPASGVRLQGWAYLRFNEDLILVMFIMPDFRLEA
jgi:hypothetical protein